MFRDVSELDFARSILFDLLKIETPSGSEEKGIRYIQYILEEFGFENFEVDYIGKDSYNLVLNPVREPDLLIVSHIDTVKVISEPKIIDEYRVGGTGAADAKGSVVSILLVLKSLKSLPNNVSVAIFSQEESSGSGSIAYLKNYKPKYALVMEPTDLNIALSGHGYIEYVLEVFGEHYHPDVSWIPRENKAFFRALKIFEDLNDFCSKEFGLNLEVLNFRTLSEDYFVPKSCLIHIDLSIPPEKSFWEIKKGLESFFEKVSNFVNYRLEDFSKPFKTNRDDFIENLIKIHNSIFVGKGIVTMKAWTDANNLSAWGVKSIVFGPGKLELAHNEGEYVDIRDILKAKEFLERVIKFVGENTF